MKISFHVVADAIFFAACPAMLLFCILRYERTPLPAACLIAVMVFCACGTAFFGLLSRTNGRRMHSRRQERELQALMLHLALEQPQRTRALLTNALQYRDSRAHTEGVWLHAEGKRFLPLFTVEPISAELLAEKLRAHGRELALICNTLSPQAEQLCRRMHISTLQGPELYHLIQESGSMPAPLICEEVAKPPFRERLQAAFARSNARPFFYSGTLLLVMSLFVLYPVYYLWAGGILLLIAAIIRLFGKKYEYYV